jgi:hypothetical protein
MEDLTGKQLGPYRVIAPLGEGGMAAVYKAYQPGMDRYVALKVLPHHFAHDPDFVSRFQREAKIIARLQHPHILPVHDFGTADGYTYLVMPFIASGTLADLLQRARLPLQQLRTVIAQVGDALDYAHARGIVHRDVKPSNILIDERGNCLLTDFGIARMVEGATLLTHTGAIMGTPAYMAPEQGLGQSVDGRSDIYALGVILYELVTGRTPFAAETPLALVLKHIHDPLPPPRSLDPSVPDDLERVILKALAKNPADRYQTAGEFVRALNETTIEEPVQVDPPPIIGAVRPEGPPTPTPRRAVSGVWITAGALGVLVLVLAAIGGMFRLSQSARPGAISSRPVSVVPIATMAPAATLHPIPSTPSARVPQQTVGMAMSAWTAIGGMWMESDTGVVHGESTAFDGLYLFNQPFTDFTFAAEVQAVDREASLALRMQDSNNGYLVIFVPSGVNDANPGLYLAKRVNGDHSFVAATRSNIPAAGEWVRISVQVVGTRIQVYLNDAMTLDFTDTTPPSFASGKVGLRLYGTAQAPCHANFRNITLPST